MLISPTEPREIQALGSTSPVPERYGVDILWWGQSAKWGAQRKEFPGDFLNSLRDGRLAKEIQQIAQLDGGGALILEGFGQWTDDGELIHSYGSLTQGQLFGLCWTAFLEHGVPVFRVKSKVETVACIEALVRWSRKAKHSSFANRPGPRSKWGTLESRDWTIHLVQGFEGIGPDTAANIVDHFNGAPFRWNVEDSAELEQIAGVGKKRAEKLWKALGNE